jgi:lipopolysaccharide/colanic/teichoic acid biosynthesis glycosyltransferase
MLRLKRAFDIVASASALIAIFPLMLAIGFLLRCTIGSPILWRQTRPGLGGKPFLILKFRTMSNETDAHGSLLPDALRLGRIGRFLRRTSLDELPELINVLRGEMSLVGPRPLLMEYLDRYTSHQFRRHEVKPGITGWAQINGRNEITWEQKFALDVWYVENVSFFLDLKILCVTAWKVLRCEGISQPGQATMSEFMGSRS